MADDASRDAVATAATKNAGAQDVAALRGGRPTLVNADPTPAPLGVEQVRSNVVHLVRRLQEETRYSGTLRRKRGVLISILLCVALPTLVASLYYFFIASDRYVSVARFAVRQIDVQTFDTLGMLVGLPASQTTSDSYIVADYVASGDMVREVSARLPVREIYSDEQADFFSRLNPEVTFEELVEYWNTRVSAFYDPTKNTISLEVQAFSPEAATRVASTVVEILRNLVNELSARARREAVQFTAAELARAELRVRGARQELLEFRTAHNDLDPILSAQATLTIAAELEAQRTQLASQVASLSGYLADDAPSVRMLNSQITALDQEITRIRSQISTATPELRPGEGTTSTVDPLANEIGKYQELLINQEFAEKAYVSAQASLDRARSDAQRDQSYLAIYGEPSPAEDALYPRSLLNVSIVFVLAGILWAVGALGFMAIRDHTS
jgi:capsular polysaccharide transport system permease protein